MAATFNIQVKMNSGGAVQGIQQVERGLTAVQRKALQVNRDLRQLFGIYAIKELVTFVYRLADGYTNLQNKLRVVTDSQSNLNAVTQATFRIAQQTRSSWESTASLYARLALNGKQLGASQQELLDFTKSLNQAIIIGGATSTEAAAGILQLSQGMASGALKGDELRAVLEQLPVVADVISKKLNVTRGQLRQMGKDGKITGDVILKAFKESADELDKKFGKTVPTLGQSFQMIKNAAMQFFGAAGAGSGVMNSLALALKFVADNMETIGKVVLAVAQAFGAFFIVQKVIALLRTLALVVATHPLLAFVAALGTALLLLRQFGDEITTGATVALPQFVTQMTGVSSVAITLGDHLRAIWSTIKELGSAIMDFLSTAWDAITGAFSDGLETAGVQMSLDDVIKMLLSFVFAAKSILKHFWDFFILIFGGLPFVIVEKFDDAFAGLIDRVQAAINWLIKKANYVAMVGKGLSAAAHGNTPDEVRRQTAEIEKVAAELQKKVELRRTAQAQGATGRTWVDEEIDQLQKQLSELKSKRDKVQAAVRDVLAPSIPDVEYDRSGVREKADAFRKEFKNVMDSVTGDIQNDLAAYDKKVKQNALDRLGKDDPGQVNTVKGQFQQTPDPNAGKEHDRLMRKLDALLKKSNEVREAEMKLAAAEKLLGHGRILEELEKRGITAATVLEDYREELSKALDPLNAWTESKFKEIAVMKGSSEEYERNSEAVKVVEDLTEKGLTLNQMQINQIERLIKLQQDRQRVWENEKQILEGLNNSLQVHRDRMAAIKNLNLAPADRYFATGQENARYTSSNDERYNSWLGMRRQVEYGNDDSKNANDLMLGSIDAVEKLQNELGNVRAQTAMALEETFGSLENFILNAAATGELAWNKMFESIMLSLDKLALKLLEQWAMMKILGLAAGGAPSVFGTGATQTFEGLYGGKYAQGGSYTVPGSGAPDSRMVTFRLSPGERVDFTPPGRKGGGNNGAPAQVVRPQVSIQNIYDRNQIISGLSTTEGRRAIVNVIREEAQAIRAIVKG